MTSNSRVHLRVPRRAQAQWARVQAKLAEQIEARGLTPDGASIFCEACAMLDGATGGSGIVADEGAPFYEAPPFYDARRKALDLAAELRQIAGRLESE